MPGFTQAQLKATAQNANTVAVLIGDQIIAFAQSVPHGFDLGTEGLYGVGSAKPQEIQQLKVAPQITVEQFKLTDAGLQKLQGNQITLVSLLANNEFNIHVVDGTNGTTQFTYVGCVAANFNENISANTVITDSISFLARDVLDVSGQSILNGPEAFSI